MCLSRYSESSESVVQVSCGVAALNSLGEAETTATRTFQSPDLELASVELTPRDRDFFGPLHFGGRTAHGNRATRRGVQWGYRRERHTSVDTRLLSLWPRLGISVRGFFFAGTNVGPATLSRALAQSPQLPCQPASMSVANAVMRSEKPGLHPRRPGSHYWGYRTYQARTR
jgi:hypothetical protein